MTATPSAGEVFLRRWLEEMSRHYGILVLAAIKAQNRHGAPLPDNVRVVYLDRPVSDTRPPWIKFIDGMGPPRWVRESLRQQPYREIIQQCDLLEVQWPSMAGALPWLRREFGTKPLTYVTHDLRMEALISLSLSKPLTRTNAAAFLKVLRVAPQELRALRAPEMVLCFRDDEKRFLERVRSGRGTVHQLEPALQVGSSGTGELPEVGRGERLRLGFVADFQRVENIRSLIWFQQVIWPVLRRLYPTVDLVLVGRYDTECERAVAGDHRVSLTGWVPCLSDVYRLFDIAIAPLIIRGGIKFKVAEALAYGLPVIGTANAAAGYPELLREHVSVAESSSDWVEIVGRYLRDDLWKVQAEDRRRRFEQSLDFAGNVDKAAAEYARIIRGEERTLGG
jgi:hypothetical protein